MPCPRWQVAAFCFAALFALTQPGCGYESVPFEAGSAASPASSSGAQAAASAKHDISELHAVTDATGRLHRYLVVTPKEPASAPLPIVMVYHGNHESGPIMQQRFQFEQISGDGAIVVYPSRASGWDVGYANENNPSVGAFDLIVDAVASAHNGDRSKVSVIGWSNGAFFAHILGCLRGNKLHALVSMAGDYPHPNEHSTLDTWPNTQIARFPGQVPVRTLVIHGTEDTIGGQGWPAMVWTHINRCSRAPNDCQWSNGAPLHSATRSPCIDMSEAPADAPVRLCPIPNLGHVIWDQAAAAAWEFIQGR